jgi:hypothetical protein
VAQKPLIGEFRPPLYSRCDQALDLHFQLVAARHDWSAKLGGTGLTPVLSELGLGVRGGHELGHGVTVEREEPVSLNDTRSFARAATRPGTVTMRASQRSLLSSCSRAHAAGLRAQERQFDYRCAVPLV